MIPMNDSKNEPTSDRSADAPAERKMRCPICSEGCDPASTSAPFCSDRCKLVDLGNWFNGDYMISRDLKDVDLDRD